MSTNSRKKSRLEDWFRPQLRDTDYPVKWYWSVMLRKTKLEWHRKAKLGLKENS